MKNVKYAWGFHIGPKTSKKSTQFKSGLKRIKVKMYILKNVGQNAGYMMYLSGVIIYYALNVV